MRIPERDSLAFGQALRELLISVVEPDAAGTGMRGSLIRQGAAPFVNEANSRFVSHVVQSAKDRIASKTRVVIE